MNKSLEKTLKSLSNAPGIYKMIDQEGRVIYIGKAKNLKKRVKQYFKEGYEHSSRTKKLLEKVEKIETIAVDSELESIILEHNLIKQLQPKYNVIMKDDKSYVYIKITKEDFPRIQVVRTIKKDSAKYIGPKTAAHKVKTTLKVLKKIFPFRHCGLDIQLLEETKDPEKDHKVKVTRKVIKYPCLDYFIKRCVAPCIGKCTKEEYAEIIKNVEDFLEGKADKVLKDLEASMMQAAKEQKFERAAKIRDKIGKISDILEKQKISDPNQQDQDIINYCVHHNQAYFNLFQVRDGKLLGQENFILKASELDDQDHAEILEAFIKQYYELATDIPKEILIPHELENQEQLSKFVEQQSTRKCKIHIPQKGKKNKLLEMSLNNARIFADRNKPSWQEESELTKAATEDLQKLLKISKPLKRIECYDISHLSGTDTVGSMIVFENGAPKKDMYRKFKLRTVQGKPDDFKSMEEVLMRRFSKIASEIQLQDYQFRKAKKADDKFIQEQSEKAGVNKSKKNYKHFYVMEKNKNITAFASIKEHDKKIAEINALWVHEKHRGKKLGHKLIKEMIKKAKAKRVYLSCHKELSDYYAIMGFEEIKKIPETLSTCPGGKTFVFDKLKLKPDKSFSKIPDLVIIDGGKGQLSSAHKVFQELSLENIRHISLAKRLEEIFQPGEKISIILEKNNEALKLLQRARDEAHRFAISYNKKLRSKRIK